MPRTADLCSCRDCGCLLVVEEPLGARPAIARDLSATQRRWCREWHPQWSAMQGYGSSLGALHLCQGPRVPGVIRRAWAASWPAWPGRAEARKIAGRDVDCGGGDGASNGAAGPEGGA